MSRARLSRAVIAEAAVALADEGGGMSGVSMRKVAANLGVGTMSLYHYVADREELLALMGDELMGELLLDEVPAGWREGLRAIAMSTLGVFDRHPWMIKAMFEETGGMGLNAMRHFEQSLTTLADLDLERRDRLHILEVVDEYAFGALIDRASPDSESEHIEMVVQFIGEHLDAEQFPHAFALMNEGEDPMQTTRDVFAEMRAEDRFERGLELVLDGVEALLKRRGAIPQ